MTSRATTLLLAAVTGGFSGAAACQTPSAAAGPNPAAAVEDAITAKGLRGSIRFLSHDLLEGRGVGTRGDRLARLYIQSQMQQFGLEPGGPDGSWEQDVPIVGITASLTTPLEVQGPGGVTRFNAPSDYTVSAGRPDARTAWKDAEIVFVGYGIHAPEQRWDDYGDFDLTGKIALVMNNDPSTSPDLFAGRTRLYYGRWSYKYEEAARRGAVGAIVIHTRPSAGYPFQVIQATYGKEQFWLPFDGKTPTLALRTWCSEPAAKRIAELGGFDLDALRQKAESRDFTPVPLGVRAELSTENEVRSVESANVIGMIRGSDPELRDQVIAVTAHFDHLGVGPKKKGDGIYNGGLDNATGTATLLSLADACARLPKAPRRTLLFLAVTAEESGLLGSLYYARNPTVPQRQIVANFNIDGINIWGPTRDLSMIGHGKNSLTALAEAVAQRRGRVFLPDPHPELGLFYRSDHFSFARIGVPSAYFKAGGDFRENATSRLRVKNMYTTVHYHQPSDEYDARWNLEGAAEDSKLLLECMLRVAQADDQPTWTAGDEFEKLWKPAQSGQGSGRK